MGYTRRLLWFIAALNFEVTTNAILYSFGELFAGERAWSKGMQSLELSGRSFDLKYPEMGPDMCHCNFLDPHGFLTILHHVLQMHVGAVFLAACPCFSWIFMTSHTTGRDRHVLGNDRPWVLAQNALVSRIVYVLILCMKRGVYWIVEQPRSSRLFEHPRWLYMIKRYPCIEVAEPDMGVYTLDVEKASVLAGTAPYLKSMGRRLTAFGKELVRSNPNRKVTTTSYIDSTGKRRCVGAADLKGTEAYAMGFGLHHAKLYEEMCQHHVTANLPGHPLVAPDPDSDSEIGDAGEECFADFKHGFEHFQLAPPFRRK